MKIKFWGLRGSIPTPTTQEQYHSRLKALLRHLQTHGLDREATPEVLLTQLPSSLTRLTGGNTTCYEIVADSGQQVIVDMGSGLRVLGESMQKSQMPTDIHILLTHTHWDHLLGLPFFQPAYLADHRIHVYGVHPHFEHAVKQQFDPHFFPVDFSRLGASFHFHPQREGIPFRIHDLTIEAKALDHPGTSYAYRITERNTSLVVATDAEYKETAEAALRPYLDFYRDAEALLFDAQYELQESIEKLAWGHSSPQVGVDIAVQAGVKRLALIHHDPNSSEEKLARMMQQAASYRDTRYPHATLVLSTPYEGEEWTL